LTTQAIDILTRDRVCMACECSDFVGDGEYLTCEHVTDDHGQPLTCRLKGMLADPTATCPHPDPAQSRRWNEATVNQGKGCGGRSPARAASTSPASVLTLRVRACLGHGADQPRCEHAGDGWSCGLIGRSIAADLKNPAFACPGGRFAAQEDAAS
jgi:hypothetical protein